MAEGEEEIASPHCGEIASNPEVLAAMKQAIGVFIPGAGQESFHMSASFGAVNMESSEEILKVAVKADLKLYEAKNRGRNRIAA